MGERPGLFKKAGEKQQARIAVGEERRSRVVSLSQFLDFWLWERERGEERFHDQS